MTNGGGADEPAREQLAPREMSLSAVRETYYEASGKASDIARQLAFAGIAVLWILSGATLSRTGGLRVTDDLLRVGFCLVLALVLDLLQYVYRSIAWGVYARYLEKHAITKVEAPDWINRPTIGLFGLKLIALGAAYALLLVAVLDRLNR